MPKAAADHLSEDNSIVMKRCPECNRTYPDDTLAFCLVDGAVLSAPYDSGDTQRIPLPRSTGAAPTELLPSHPPQPVRHKGNSRATYIIIAVMTGLVVGLAGIIIIPRMGRDSTALNQEVNSNGKPSQDTSDTEPSRPLNNEGGSPTLPGPSNSVNPSTSATTADLSGEWRGQWMSPYGTTFSAGLHLEPAGTDNGVQGYINWTMKSTPQESKRAKVGLTAVEYVKGSYDQGARMLVMEGYRKDDPNDIISLDKYRLVLAEGGESLEGKTWNHGGWRGRLTLNR